MAFTALTEEQIHEHLSSLPGWVYADGVIAKTYSFPNYPAGIMFAGLVGAICEARNHHPDLMSIGYKTVKVSFVTHDAGSIITEYDIQAAAAIEAVGYPK